MARGGELNRYEAAVLNAGPRRAVRAGIASLLARGELMATPGSRLTASGSGRPAEHPIEAEIIAAAAGSPTLRRVVARVSRGPAIRGMTAQLTERGYLLPLLGRLFGRSLATAEGTRALARRQQSGRSARRAGTLDPGSAVALFGPRSLWALDPQVARTMGIPFAAQRATETAFLAGTFAHSGDGHHGGAAGGGFGGHHGGGGFGGGGHGGGGHG